MRILAKLRELKGKLNKHASGSARPQVFLMSPWHPELVSKVGVTFCCTFIVSLSELIALIKVEKHIEFMFG